MFWWLGESLRERIRDGNQTVAVVFWALLRDGVNLKGSLEMLLPSQSNPDGLWILLGA